ncbi:hypothetical protein [Streptomyces sp. S186]|uniref:hypothetical protein n=1 Tax=Streptomyces sp. S186 TaxID=3434395 RepID=UPI003F6818CF
MKSLPSDLAEGQIARDRGITVIGTAGGANQDYLRSKTYPLAEAAACGTAGACLM